MPTKISEDEFIRLWDIHGSARGVATASGLSEKACLDRRRRMVNRGHTMNTRPAPGYEGHVPAEFREGDGWTFPRQIDIEVDTGSVIVSSDHHYWPGKTPIAHHALLNVIDIVKPREKILNGDIFDGVSVSRHAPFGWGKRPTVKQELEACQARVGEIEQALPKGCGQRWTLGNHCIRFERALATQASEFEGLAGWRLHDHFDQWDMAWSFVINRESKHPVMVKHRQAGGVHAGYNNTMKGGWTVVTGHTHLLEVKPWGDWRGRRWGVQTGTLADVDGPQFEYQENNASAACSGFAVLTFRDGELMPPELCEVINGRAYFRGKVVA